MGGNVLNPSKNVPLRISALYLLFGVIWILLSDVSMVWTGVFEFNGYIFSLCKGIFFVVVSAFLLYLLTRHQLNRLDRANALALAVVNGTTDAVFVKDHHGRYLMFNQAAAKFVGKNIEDVIGQDDNFLFDPASAAKIKVRDRQVMESGMSETAEEVLSAANSTRVYSATKVPYRDASGRVIGLIGISRDITERMDAERQLRMERDRLTLIVDAVPLVICSFLSRPDGTITMPFSSSRIASIYGISGEELSKDATQVFSRIHPGDVQRVVESIETSAQTLTVWECEYRVCRPGLEDIWVEGRSAPTLLEDGSILWHGYIADITDRKRHHQALHATQHRLEHAQLIAKMGSWTWYPPSNYVWWSDAIYKLYGLDPATTTPAFQHILDRLEPADRQIAINRVEAMLNGADEFSNEFLANRADGRKIWVLSVARATRDAGGRLIQVDGFDQDISNRKEIEEDRRQIEEELRVSEERLRLALKHAGGGVWDWELHTDRAWWSPEMYALWGTDPSETMKLANSLEIIHEADRELVRFAVEEAIDSRGDYHAEFRIRHPTLGDRWIASRGKTICNSDGSMRLIGISQDITDRMNTEQALRESELRFRNLVTALPDAVGIIINERLVFSNPALLRLLKTEDSQQILDKPYSHIFPENGLADIQTHLAQLPKNETNYSWFETEVKRVDGQPVCVQMVALRIMDRNVESVLIVLHDLSERKRVEMQIRHQELILREAAEMAHVGGWSFVPATEQMEWTGAVAQIHELDDNTPKSVAWTLQCYEGEDRERLASAMQAAKEHGTPFDLELNLRSKQGTKFVRKICHPVMDDGRVVLVRGSLQDISDRRRLEVHLRQSQKMEAVGRLAGGVAHDFNNLLTVINGYCRLLVDQYSVPSDTRDSLCAIQDAADRATRLTRQLLSFSRKAMVELQILDLNQIVSRTATMLQRLVGEDISLELLLATSACYIEADPIQIDQVILNLTVNARDASKQGGVVTIATSSVELPSRLHTTTGTLPKGKYIVLTVTDQGSGMSDAVKAKIFEPFFSTKERDKGTGLGLAVVHGITIQSGGQIDVTSEVGQGSTFRIFFKEVTKKEELAKIVSLPVVGGKETILLVEDEDAIRLLCMRTLQAQGYRVMAAASGSEAINLFSQASAKVDILVTDLMMPKMNGRELAEILREKVPHLSVLYISGYSGDLSIQPDAENGVDAFLQKPFLPIDLASKVRCVLDERLLK